MIRQQFIKRKTGTKGIRWRLHSPSRIEALTDSVFAFAVTLIVVSLEVPKTFKDLLYSMQGFLGFSICFGMLMLIWYEQYLYFRRYGLQDIKTIALNCLLLFIVLFYVYPLKFLFGFLTQGNETHDVTGNVIYKFTENYQISQLMIVYGAGYIFIYVIFFLMYLNAYRNHESIQLNRVELFNTKTFLYSKIVMTGVGVFSIVLAIGGVYINPWLGMLSGISYILIGPALGLLYSRRKKILKRIYPQEEIDKVNEEIIVMETKTVSPLPDSGNSAR
jgi:uncharacterized membrane protein